MATVRPFKAVRPDRKYADRIICLPYDVMDREEACGMAKGNPLSFLHIVRAEIDLPDEAENSPLVYEKARQNLDKAVKEGIFIQDSRPCFYIYREEMAGRIQTGFFACVSVDEYEQGIIKKHELTRYEKELDRINHFDACDANTEPVYIAYREDKKLRNIMERWISGHMPEYNVTGIDGVRHLLWPMDDQRTIAEIIRRFRDIPSLYLVDGHHRSASSYAVAKKRREEKGAFSGEEEFNFFMAAIFPDRDLNVMDYNRVVKDLRGMDKDTFINRIEEAGFRVEMIGTEARRPGSRGCFGMYLEGNWYMLTASRDIIPDDLIGSLDVSILQDNILGPILGIDDPRGSERIDFVGGIRGLKELERRVDADMAVAFSMYPVDMADIMRVADASRIMPPKSTWVEPKLGSGLVIHHY